MSPDGESAAGAGVHAALPEVGQHHAEGQRSRVSGRFQGLQKNVVALEVKVNHLLRLQILQTQLGSLQIQIQIQITSLPATPG